jgi:hypothetical protein
VVCFLGIFKKWGPSARTCVDLACGFLNEEELQKKAISAAKKFTQDPAAITMQASSQDVLHVLFTVTPNENRSIYTLRVTTPHLICLVMEEMSKFDAADQLSFYHRVSHLPQFQGTLGYMYVV